MFEQGRTGTGGGWGWKERERGEALGGIMGTLKIPRY